MSDPSAQPQPQAEPAPVAPPPPAPTAMPYQAPGIEHVGGYPLASVGKRLGAYLLESVLVVVTLGIGWIIWAAMLAGDGQTPAKKLLGLRVKRLADGSTATFGTMFFLRGIVGGIVAGFAYPFTLGILILMPLWDRRNQTVTDKVSSCVVVDES